MASGFSGKKILIVGGSTGIGQAAAIDLARRGADVWVSARGEARLQETVERLRDVGGSAQRFGYEAFDVTSKKKTARGVGAAVEALGGVDVLICNTGFARTGTVMESDLDDFEAMMDLNYLGHVRVVKAALPSMLESQGGHICLVSSMLGFMSAYGYGAYSASKHAIVGFAGALRQEVKDAGIGVSVFYPPTTRTPGLDAENEHKSELIWELERNNNFTKIYDADVVAQSLIKQIETGKYEGLTGVDSWVVKKISQVAPPLFRFLADDELAKARKNVKK